MRHVAMAFAFIDLCGFTRLFETAGGPAVVDVLAEFRRIVRKVCPDAGVKVEKWLGDGAMLLAPDPGSVAAAVRTVGTQLDAPSQLPLRAGLASGPTLLFEGDEYIGWPVNLAARLCNLAGPGELLAPVGLLDGPGVEHRTLNVRGFRGMYTASVTPLSQIARWDLTARPAEV
jgi:adenylate cyclase